MFIALFLIEKTNFDKLNLPSNDINLYYTNHNLLRTFINKNPNLKLNIKYDSKIKNLKQMSLKDFLNSNEDIYLNLDSDVSINNYEFLESINDSSILAPLIKSKNALFSNFWGDIDENGFYKRSQNYINIYNQEILGTFECKYINSCFAFKKNIIRNIINFYSDNFKNEWDYDATFAYNCRINNINMFVNNNYIGVYEKIISIYDYFTNKMQWIKKYFHPKFIQFINGNNIEYKVICPDAYQFPIFTETFCTELINITEEKNLWSSGRHKDNRIQGGYENHPTVDVHLNQIKLENIWNDIVKSYISKLAYLLYSGITTKGTNLNFVVKYSKTGQTKLNPHHDASIYTVNIALNNNFKGGGCHFLRQNVKVTDNPIGYSLIHPGRLTHYHAGLELFEGNRYILVSFIE